MSVRASHPRYMIWARRLDPCAAACMPGQPAFRAAKPNVTSTIKYAPVESRVARDTVLILSQIIVARQPPIDAIQSKAESKNGKLHEYARDSPRGL